jgi:Helix-turn-helix domain
MVRSIVVLKMARSTFSGAPPMPRRSISRLAVAWSTIGSGQFEGEQAVSTSVDIIVVSYRPCILIGMQLRYRYRYRLTPTVEQRQALARAFGCARVVYNDALRLREDA